MKCFLRIYRYFVVMNFEAKKYHLIERLMKSGEDTIDRMEAFLKSYDPEIERELTNQALEAEEDIKKGNVYSIDEANTILTRRLSS